VALLALSGIIVPTWDFSTISAGLRSVKLHHALPAGVFTRQHRIALRCALMSAVERGYVVAWVGFYSAFSTGAVAPARQVPLDMEH
jgi:hypothetical protein